ncbi:AIM24 family protein [Conexibacter sp. SYSU D00693]|uniref:AIM24 family protein n=1 Tax=Conexibacter sp. SYSU D00693 TaxID=2812560 RepID=UPI00196B70FF|nr:AIM24 family protein [Conexibacter sp. SYSU D00693]
MRTTFQDLGERESADAFSLQNAQLLKVELRDVTIQAKLGSMVAYQGDVSFEHAGMGGVGRFMKKALTGEGQRLMKVSGTGEVFLADTAQYVHLVHLEDDQLTVSGESLLAFDDGIDWDVERVKGASGVMGAGLFNTILKGTGWVALLTDGTPMVLDVASAPTFADAQAVVAWSAGVQTSLKTEFKAKNLIGRGSGETLQMAFSGAGWVLVQPSEGRPTVPTDGSGGGLGGLLGQ